MAALGAVIPALFVLPAAFGADATLHVAVHREAGSLQHVAADGAAGQCVAIGTSRLVCPANGPVSFRWGRGGPWELTGDTVVEPGSVGVAYLLPPESERVAERARLAEESGPAVVRELFVMTSTRPVPVPSRGMFDDLLDRLDDPDWRVRREVVRGLVPYARHTSSDPFPPDAPSLLPAGTLVRLVRDPDRRVRQRAAALIRELGPEDPVSEEGSDALVALLHDPAPGVRRAAITAATASAAVGAPDAVQAWHSALGRVPEPGSVGRAACNGLARLRGLVDPEAVDVEGALALVFEHHPERAWRVWGAWREVVPFDAGRASFLLRRTTGLSESLLRWWAEREPAALAGVLRDWEPRGPHSERFRVISAWLLPRATDPALREVLELPADSLSPAFEGPSVE